MNSKRCPPLLALAGHLRLQNWFPAVYQFSEKFPPGSCLSIKCFKISKWIPFTYVLVLFSLVSLPWFLDRASLGTRHASVHGVTRIQLGDSATTTTCLCTSLVRTGAPFLAVSHFSWMQSHWFSNPVVLGAHFSSARIQSWGARFGLEFVTPQGKGLRSFEVL